MMIGALVPKFAELVAADGIEPHRDGRRLAKLMREFEVKWLLIDRADQLASRQSLRSGSCCSNTWANCAVEAVRPINLILCGREPTAELVKQTPELAAGAVNCLTDVYKRADEAEFVSFVRAFLDRGTQPTKFSVLDETSLLQRLIDETGGTRGYISNLVVQAVMIATRDRRFVGDRRSTSRRR